MEEIRRGNKRNTLLQEGRTDPLSLFEECQNQLLRLNKQLGVFFEGQRTRQIQRVLPSIETLGHEISELKENISYEATPQQKLSEREAFAHARQGLLMKLKVHSREIEKSKKRLRLLNISYDELVRQYEQNKALIEKHEGREEKEVSFLQSSQEHRSMITESSYNQGLEAVKIKGMSSVFSGLRKEKSNISLLKASKISESRDSKWERVDKLLAKISMLKSEPLADRLLLLAKREKGGLKGMMKNYQVSDRMGQLLRQTEARQQWARLQQRVLS